MRLLAATAGAPGDAVVASYGPMPAGEYLERYGFLPTRGAARRFAAAAEVRFELDADTRFVDDKLMVLADAGAIASDALDDGYVEACLGGEPDDAVLRFLRLAHLDGEDAFLLEPLFAATLWDVLAAPLSRANERAALRAVADEVDALAAELADPVAGAAYEALRRVELAAIDATRAWARGEEAALDGKAYYQERRLKDLGLDTDWAEGEGNAWTGSRAGGGADW